MTSRSRSRAAIESMRGHVGTLGGILVAAVAVAVLGSVACGANAPDVGQASARKAEGASLLALKDTLVACVDQTDPDHVSMRLEGCRNDGSILLPIGGKFVCPDAAYTTGNLGKGWNELDLVPYRVTFDAGNAAPATQTYVIGAVVDNFNAGMPGYDVISEPVLNTALSSAACAEAGWSTQLIATPGLGGIDTSIYRLIEVTQPKNTVCVYDYYARLALGSHLFPGSSLHANLALPTADVPTGCLTTSGIGARDVSIPVKEILPQELRKDMAGTQGTDHIWNLTKAPTPANLTFDDTCDPAKPASQQIQIAVTWEKLPASPSGEVTVITHVYAKNPAARTITVDVTDTIYEGTTQVEALDVASSGPVDVPANTEQLVLTHTFVWANPDPAVSMLNDVATATYIDKITGVPVPGNTTATASGPIQLTGPELNASAWINDLEWISGADFSYSADSFWPEIGGFDFGYVAGTKTKGNVSWTSAEQPGSGGVLFGKTVYVDQATISSGTLSDTATLTGSSGFTASASASIGFSANAKVSLAIQKSVPASLGVAQDFVFHVYDAAVPPNEVPGSPVTIGFAAGESSKSATVTGLPPGSYTVSEEPALGWQPLPDQQVAIGLPACSGSVTFDNAFLPTYARVKKVTSPAGFEASWTFTLNGPGTPVGGETVTTSGAGFLDFTTQLQDGAYTITEVAQAGWQSDGGVGCAFTVSLPADGGKTFDCVFTNTYQPSITVGKSCDGLSKIGDPVDYQITVTNTGPAGGAAGAPSLACTITDALLGVNQQATLAAGASATIDQTRPPQAGDPDPLTNTAGASCKYPGLDAVVASAQASCSTNLFQPSITFAKTADAELSKVGHVVNYTLTLTNTSSADSPDLVCTITDAKLGVTRQVTLASGASDVVNAPYTVVAGDPDPLVNTADVSCWVTGFTNVLTASDSWSVELFQPSVKVEKFGPEKSKVGDTVAYEVQITNTSSADSPSLVLDSFSDSLVPGVIPPFNCNSLAPGATCSVLYGYTVQAGDPDPLPNTATVHYHPLGFTNDISGSGSWTVNLFQPSISFAKTADAELSKVTDAVTYTLTLHNTSSADSPDLVCTITDAMLGVSKQVTLASGGNDVTSVFYTVQTGDPDPLVNTASVSCQVTGFPNILTASGSKTVNLFQPSIAFAKTADTRLSKVTDAVTYTLTLVNTSSADSPDLVCTITDAKLGVNKPVTLASGGSDVVNVPYTVQAGDPDPLVNTASVSCQVTGFPNVLIASDSWEVNLFQPSVTVTKAGPDYSKATDTATYTVTIQNTSSADSPSLVLDGFTDSIALGATPPPECSELAPGGSCEFVYYYVVQAGDPDPLVNTATVHYRPAGFPNDVTASSSWTTDLLHPSFAVTKVCKASTEPVPQAGPAVFTITFANTGDADLHVVPSEGAPFDVAAGASYAYEHSIAGPFADQVVGNTVTGTVTLAAVYGLGNSYDFSASGSCTVEGKVKVAKTVSGGVPAADQVFTFQLRQGASTTSEGTVLEQKTTDASGSIAFTTSLVPGQTYQICEWVFPGWNTNLVGDGALFVPNSIIPPALPNPNVNNLTVCADFSVSSGQTRTFAVDNTPPPGGRALTIGFWKNWASCAGSRGGGQEPMLDRMLEEYQTRYGGMVVSAETGTYALFGPTFWLALHDTNPDPEVASDCQKAVRLLNKSNIATNKKMASDPAFNLAAQLVAAELNIIAGSGYSPSVLNGISQAVLLLGKYHFDGITHTPISAADATAMNNLARYLDDYNNNRL